VLKKNSLFIVCMLLLGTIQVQAAEPDSWQSERGRFIVSYESQLDPITINQMHSWTLHITAADGSAVPDAELAIAGGMPEHNHGLATAPDFEPLGDGDYMLQGLRFHMMGYWELELTVSANGVKDTVIIPLEL